MMKLSIVILIVFFCINQEAMSSRKKVENKVRYFSIVRYDSLEGRVPGFINEILLTNSQSIYEIFV